MLHCTFACIPRAGTLRPLMRCSARLVRCPDNRPLSTFVRQARAGTSRYGSVLARRGPGSASAEGLALQNRNGDAMIKIGYHYRPGDRVLFYPPPALSQFEGTYRIERRLPISADGPNYLIKRMKDGHERAAPERELAPVPSADA